jgi:hypothetical protein
MKRLKALFVVVALACALFALAWVADLFSIRGLGWLALLFSLGSSVLGFFMTEFERNMKGERLWVVEAAYVLAIALAFVAIEAGVPQSTGAARIFVLFLAVPLLSSHVIRHFRI